MKKLIAIISFILITIVAFTGCAKQTKVETKVEKPEKIRIGYQPGINHALLIVAKQQGWFEEEFKKDGITVEFESFTSGPPMIEAFAGKRLDLGQVGDQPAIQARANNIDIKAIGVYSSGEKINGLVVAKDSSIKEVKDIKGKKVGVTIGSTGHILLLRYLESAGLTTKDVSIVNLQPAEIKTSLASKNIDAAVTWEPYVSSIEVEGIGTQIADGTNLRFDTNLIIATNEFAQKYPDIVKRILKIYDKSENWVKSNQDAAIDLVAKDIKMNKEVLVKAFPKEIYDIRLTDKVTNAVSDTIKTLKNNNTIKTEVKVEDLIDNSYLKSIGK